MSDVLVEGRDALDGLEGLHGGYLLTVPLRIVQGLCDELEAARKLIDDVASSAVEFEDERVGYVAVQIDRAVWEAIRAYIDETKEAGTP